MNIENETLFNAINKWEETAPTELLLDINALKAHMFSEHGIEMTSWIGLRPHRIVDEKKYVMFLLKFG